MSDRSLSKNTFLHLSVTLFNLIDKVYTKVTLAKTDCSFHLVTGMLFVAHDDLLSSMHLTYVSHIMGQKIIYSSLNTAIHFLAQHLLYRDFETV